MQSHENIIIPNQFAGLRLDVALAKLMPSHSRSRLALWIKNGAVQVNGQTATPKLKLIGGEQLSVTIQPTQETLAYLPESMDLNIIFEDDDIIIINKPAQMVVHPAAGNWQGTLLNGLLAYCPALQSVPRAGIVHRLDKDTTGLMVVAKNLTAQTSLIQQLQARQVKRIYRAIADGVVPFDGKIETQIGRDPHNRTKMAVVPFGGKEAITHVKVLERYTSHSYIECSLETGRTHQIRVHMRAAKHPLSGDPIYGNPRHPASDLVKSAIQTLNRQALHAYQLSLVHPKNHTVMQFEAPIPEDMYYLLSVLRLENGMDSAIKADILHTDDESDDWHDDYDVEVVYVRDNER